MMRPHKDASNHRIRGCVYTKWYNVRKICMSTEKPGQTGEILSPEEQRNKIESMTPEQKSKYLDEYFENERKRRSAMTEEERNEEDNRKHAEFLASAEGVAMEAEFKREAEAKKELPADWLETVRLLASNQMEWAASIGVTANPVHDEHNGNFSNIKLMDAGVFREKHPKGFKASASPFEDKEILLPDDTSPQDAFYFINHELVHTTDGAENKISEALERVFTKTGKTVFASETVTEMISLESLAYLRGKDQEKDYLTNIDTVGYVPYLLIINEMVKELATKTGRATLDVRKQLYEAYYAGTLDAVWDIFEFSPATLD